MNPIVKSLYSKKGLQVFLESQGMRTARALGQHFFLNHAMLHDILQAAAYPHEGKILEIGPGLGHLTWALLEHGLDVVAIEKDQRFATLLETVIERAPEWHSRVEVRRDDALKTDFGALQEETGARYAIGNLPYNVAVPILFHVAYSQAHFDQMGFMVQKEVGERMTAPHGKKPYGRLSIVLQYLFDIEPTLLIPPSAFFPPPKVESLFVTLKPRPGADKEFAKRFLERVVHVAFLHRRKKLRKVLRNSIIERRTLDDDLLDRAAERFHFEDRAEHWPVQQWVEFAHFIQEQPRCDQENA